MRAGKVLSTPAGRTTAARRPWLMDPARPANLRAMPRFAHSTINRREFIIAAGAGAMAAAAMARAADRPLQRVVAGVMGTAGRGTELARVLAGTEGVSVKYVCDVDRQHAAKAAAAVAAVRNTPPQTVGDFRRILDDREVDAIAIAAPDHWHAPAAILACAAGKHVYLEKPCSHNPREGELLVAATRKHNRIVQHGTQRRSWPGVRQAVALVRQGAIGRPVMARGWYNNLRPITGRCTEAPVPEGLDWDMWQGPAPRRPYRENIVHYKWHWFWHWGTGELGNNGVHSLDVCRWGLGVDYPRRVTSGGGRYFFQDDQETPDTHVVTFDFGDVFIAWEGRSCQPRGFENSRYGVAFYGTGGTLVIDGGSFRILDLKDNETGKGAGPGGDADHIQNFIDAIRGRATLNAEIEEGHKSTLLCHLGNIAYRTGRTLNIDRGTGRIVGDPAAEALWARQYAPGWEPGV